MTFNWKIDPSTKIILKVVGILLILLLMWVIRDIVMILLLSIVLASAMEPLVAYLQSKKIPRYVSVLTVYILVIGIVVTVFAAIVPVTITQFTVLATNLPDYAQQIVERFPTFSLVFGDFSATQLGGQVLNAVSGNETLIHRTVGIFNGLFGLITILVVSFYLVAEQEGLPMLVKTFIPKKQQAFTLSLISKIQWRMGRWVIGQIILSFSIFALTYIGLTILGVKHAFFLALLAGLFEVVPYIGPFLSAVPAVFFALIQSPALAVAVGILYLVIQKTEGYFLVPKIMQKSVGTSPLVVLLSLLIGFKLAGILGLLLAVPVASAVTLVLSELYGAHEEKLLQSPSKDENL